MINENSCTKCKKPAHPTQKCDVCGDPLHNICGYMKFTDSGIVYGHKYCLKFMSNTTTKEDNSDWDIEKYVPERLELFDTQGNFLCVCNNEVEFFRARQRLMELEMIGCVVVREDGTKVYLNKYGNPTDYISFYEEHEKELENLLIKQTQTKSKDDIHWSLKNEL